MKSKTLLAAAAVAAVSLTTLSLTACSGASSSPSGSSGGVIKIGAVMPLTGQLAALGKGDKEGAEQAVADINAAGGIDGKKVKLTVVDDKTDPTESVKQFNQLAADSSYSAMLASSMTSAAAAVNASITQYKVPTIALSAVQTYADGSNPYAFTSPPPPRVYAKALVDYWKDQGVKTLAITYTSNDLFGQSGETATKGLAKDAGIKVVLDEPYDTTATDFTPLITKVVDAKPDAFVVWGSGPAPVIITKQVANKGVQLYLTGAEASHLYLDPAGDAATGAMAATTAAMAGEHIPDGPYKDKVMAVVTPWLKANKDVYPPEFAFGGTSAIELLKAAIDKAGSTDRGKIRDALENLDLLTANGHYKFSKDNHMGLDSNALAIMVVKDGEWTPTEYAINKFKTDVPK